ncbi:uncharacterized protein BYT42DRAFT_642429 [Radiomyces spectabilis]|uniref:uncharacterized protein n=1 Tax=Radiomyces spectabilis TaxID=64574 RepID=UPI00221FF1D8|nr:uncharacterized protein BYT42DRAFT_642429 [Radiomyces spectabilis]KAI8388165.1 hypothetical protein BYT42DRAFT_642429 [Radiomyces spectabilis]
MAFLSGFVKTGLSLLGKDSSAFPYTVGDKVEWFDSQSIWSLHHGVKKEDNSKASIFVFDGSKNRDSLPLARNMFRRIRTMRHPDLLCYLDGIEDEQTIMFATDPVEPLSSQLGQAPDQNLILWGLYKIAHAIQFINQDCDMVHGNIRLSSIFINQAGEWKLGGFEVLSSMKDESPMILTFGGLVSDAQKYASPEVQKSGWTVLKDLPPTAEDSYQLGCLIFEAYNRRFDTADQLVSQRGEIPANMYPIYKALLRPSGRTRADAASFLEEGSRPNGFFDTDFIHVNQFLENITIKDQHEKDAFLRKLDTVIESFPTDFAKYKILPELTKAFEFGSGGAKALNAILKIGDQLANDEYEKIIVAPIVRMFASPDRAIRISLLENMQRFISHIPNKVVVNQIFPNVATGFTDTVPLIREQTIKATLLLVPKLSDRIINYDLLKYMAKLQMDEEPGIRTNTTICLGKIAKHLSDDTRKKVLIPAFTRSLRDGFHHARIAALMALTATAEYYAAPECANRIIPCIATVLIDKEKPVRDQAFKAMNTFLTRVQEFADNMPETALEPSSSPAIASKIEGDATSSPMSSMGVAGVFGGATKGLAGWAVSSLHARFGTPSGEINSGNPLPTNGSAIPAERDTGLARPIASSERLAQIGMAYEEDGWPDDSKDDLIEFSENDGWEPFETNTVEKPVPISDIVPAVPKTRISTFATANHPSGSKTSMKLGHTTKSLASQLEEEATSSMRMNSASTSNPSSIASHSNATSPNMQPEFASKEDRKAELERRREERRQRMAELRNATQRNKTEINRFGLESIDWEWKGENNPKTSSGLLLAFLSIVGWVQAYVILPTPTVKGNHELQALASPTAAPDSRSSNRRLARRQLEENLSLYQNWADVCNNEKGNNVRIQLDNQDVRQLWQTVTETVYCGHGQVKTVTKTVTAKSTATSTVYVDKDKNKKPKCDDKCWSDYLWHTYGHGISVAQGFTGIVCVLIGIYFILFGFRFFRPTLALTGFVFFATMTWIGLVNNEPAYGYPHTEIIYICVSIGLGLLGAVLFMFLYPLGLYMVGALAGFYLAVYILSWKENLVITIKVARICFIVGMGVVMAILVFLAESYVIIFSTAVIGAYLFIFGLDFFIHTGFINSWLAIFDGNQYHRNSYLVSTPIYIMLAFIAFLILLSAGWQYYWNIVRLKRRFGVNVIEVPAEK